MIRVDGVGYRVGKKELLHQVSFEALSGQLVSIIGANGAGKSSLLKLLCGDQKASSGEIWIKERRIDDYHLGEMARFRAVLSQHNTLSLSFTVKELVLMGRYPHFGSQPTPSDIEIVDSALGEVGMLLCRNRAYHTLSGGEQQRVQVARVLAQVYDQPEGILLLDEPTNGLDMLYQQQVLQLARNLADRGYCVVSILHDINYAARFSDKILMLKDGHEMAFGRPAEVVNCDTIHQVFGIKVRLVPYEHCGCPLVVPEI
ncbi:heme ABC transporter ATP-binding protein [Olivibacter sitiensis]|uniref:heme ABC transporter ATP-binding protein n=1 Tax=Olivibacter sitiensis TaxID=376470 RepID=UPI0003FFE915|nr:heme ABC transporter ATP-binding protein [Olivibacter sitiensis]